MTTTEKVKQKESIAILGVMLATVGVLCVLSDNKEYPDDDVIDDYSMWGKLLFVWACFTVFITKEDKPNSGCSSTDHSYP